MLFLVVADHTDHMPKIKAVEIGKTAEFNLGDLHFEVLTDDCSRVIQSDSTLLVYETVFPNQMIELPSINESMLDNLLDDVLRYFLVLDFSKKTITIAKSHSAARSLYYYIDQDNHRLFCSTKISLLRKHGVPIRENKDILPEFFMSRFVAPPNTMYDKIFKVTIGQKTKITLGEDFFEANACSSYIPPEANNESFHANHYSSRLLKLITQSLLKTLGPDKNASFLLSGGLDTSILAKIGIRKGIVHKTFSTSYPFIDSANDTEKQYALTAAKAFGTSHKYFRATTEEFFKSLFHCIAINELPIPWPQSAMLYLLFTKCLPRESRTIVCGYGADSIFGSGLYPLKTLMPFMKVLSFLRMRRFSKILVRALNLFFKKDARIISASLKKDLNNPENVIWDSTSYADESWICKKFNVPKNDIIKGRLKLIQQYKGRALFDIICLLDLYEGAETQESWNKLAESAGKKVIYPFANKRLVDLSFTIPWPVKLREPKYMLRCVARELAIPEFIVTRRKSSFGLATSSSVWGKPGGVFEPLMSICREYFSDDEIWELQTGAHAGDKRKAATLWSVILYSIWRKIMIENVPVSDLVRLVNDKI